MEEPRTAASMDYLNSTTTAESQTDAYTLEKKRIELHAYASFSYRIIGIGGMALSIAIVVAGFMAFVLAEPLANFFSYVWTLLFAFLNGTVVLRSNAAKHSKFMTKTVLLSGAVALLFYLLDFTMACISMANHVSGFMHYSQILAYSRVATVFTGGPNSTVCEYSYYIQSPLTADGARFTLLTVLIALDVWQLALTFRLSKQIAARQAGPQIALTRDSATQPVQNLAAELSAISFGIDACPISFFAKCKAALMLVGVASVVYGVGQLICGVLGILVMNQWDAPKDRNWIGCFGVILVFLAATVNGSLALRAASKSTRINKRWTTVNLTSCLPSVIVHLSVTGLVIFGVVKYGSIVLYQFDEKQETIESEYNTTTKNYYWLITPATPQTARLACIIILLALDIVQMVTVLLLRAHFRRAASDRTALIPPLDSAMLDQTFNANRSDSVQPQASQAEPNQTDMNLQPTVMTLGTQNLPAGVLFMIPESDITFCDDMEVQRSIEF